VSRGLSLQTKSDAPLLAPRFLEPRSFRWGKHAAADGTMLRWGHLGATRPRIACVLVGGFTEFIEKYFETVQDLVARGISVWCLDWRGQGGSERPALLPTRPRARDYDRDAADLAHFAGEFLPEGLPRLLIAHSMGGAIGLLSMHRHPGLFDAAVLSAPMLGLATGHMPRVAARLIASFAASVGLGARFIPGAGSWLPDESRRPELSRTSSDPERFAIEHAWFVARPELRVDGPTYGWVDAAFAVTERLQDPGLLAGIATPILIGSAEREALVDNRAHRRAAESLRDCTVVDLPGSKHEPFLERDEIRKRWLAAIDDFIAARLLTR
jgi:lysophospholipase